MSNLLYRWFEDLKNAFLAILGTQNSRLITNLSGYPLSAHEISALQKGIKFVPTRRFKQHRIVDQYFNNFVRRMTLYYYYRDNIDPTPPIRKPSNWTPPFPDNTNLHAYLSAVNRDLQRSQLGGCPFTQENLTHLERTALKKLQENRDIIIKPDDKGGSIVIMNTTDYINKINNQLQKSKYYKKLRTNPIPALRSEISGYIDHLEHRGYISKQVAQFLQPTNPPRTPIFYGLPKIHKPDVPLRPIVSANDSPAENISSYIDYLCQPLMRNRLSYIKDTKDFLQQVLNSDPLPKGTFLVTADVVSLYTNIPHDEGIQSLLNSIDTHRDLLPDDIPPKHCIKTMLDYILKHNYVLRVYGRSLSADTWNSNGHKVCPSLQLHPYGKL